MNWKYLVPAILAALLWAGAARAQSAGVQYGDPCSMVECPDHSTCMFTNVGVVCNCDWGYVPDEGGGCRAAECTDSSQCGAGESCIKNDCVVDEAKIKARKLGRGLLIPGIILTAVGTGLVGTSIYFRQKSRHCTTDIFGFPNCRTDYGSQDYKLFASFMITGVVLGGAGLAMLIVGAVKLSRSRSIGIASDTLRLEPWMAAIPGGAVAGVGGRF